MLGSCLLLLSFRHTVVHSLGYTVDLSTATMSESDSKEKDVNVTPHHHAYANSHHRDEEVGIVNKAAPLKTDLRNRHMQMIAVGMLDVVPSLDVYGPY